MFPPRTVRRLGLPLIMGVAAALVAVPAPAQADTARGTGFYEILPAVQIPFALPETTFRVRPAATRTTLARKAVGQGRDRLTVGVREQTEQGWSPANGIQVRLERREDGRWVRVPGLALTTVHGRATALISSAQGGRVRAVVPAKGNHGGSASPAVPLGG